jgi:2'-hydroxyisoflavone reductase
MEILIIGGTIFLGRHLAQVALQRGHRVTLFNRGRSAVPFDGDVEAICGDRTVEADLAQLAGRRFDAVIDTCGYVPRIVRISAQLLAPNAARYCFVSSVSVYSGTRNPGTQESGDVGILADPGVEEISGETYGPLKALCEAAVFAAAGTRGLIVRPGLIVGPHDPSDRFTNWLSRIARGGRFLAPEGPGVPVQIIDVRDLALWIVRHLENGGAGTYNAVGPELPLTLGEVFSTCRTVTDSDGEPVWVAPAFLEEQKIAPWSDLPLYVSREDAAGFNAIDAGRAVAAGLTFRPLSATVRDTLSWERSRPKNHVWRAGLTPEREAAALAEWQKLGASGA